ncbi:MAG: hypothetical protein ACYTJ0_17810 [Planctomycetota bacterium]|jgi:hypothetical protein
MHLRFTRSILAIVCMCGMLAASPASAAPPASIGHLTNISGLPDARQQSQLRAFAEFYARRLASDDPVAVSEARDSLAQPLRALQLSRFFRTAYSDVLLPLLSQAIDDAQTLQGPTNAVQIAAQLGTDQALGLLQQHCNVRDQKNVGLRLWAARGIQVAINEGRDDQLIPDHKLSPALRSLGDAAEAEPDWRVLQWQFDSLASIDHSVARSELQRAFAAVLDRIAATSEASALVKAIGQYSDPRSRPRGPLGALSNRFIGMPAATQRSFGGMLAGELLQVLEIAEAHWESAQASRDLKPPYQRVIRISERQFAIILVTLGSQAGNSGLEQAFADGNRDTYRDQLGRLRQAYERLR